MDNQDKPATAAEIEEVQRRLAETANDPDLFIISWCHTFCGKCNNWAGDCKCSDQPWNFSFDEQQKWYKDHLKTIQNKLSSI